MATLEKIHAMCDSDDQCRPVVRGSAPHPFTGVGMCGCFAESDIDPFDQCEGDRESCATARCIGEDVDNCYDMEAYCIVIYHQMIMVWGNVNSENMKIQMTPTILIKTTGCRHQMIMMIQLVLYLHNVIQMINVLQ